MRSIRAFLPVALGSLALLMTACQKELSHPGDQQVAEVPATLQSIPGVTECGDPVLKDLYDMGNVADRGDVRISNDKDNIIIQVSSDASNIYVKRIIALYGSHDHVYNGITETLLWTPCDGPAHPDRVKISDPNKMADTIMIPNSAFQSDGCTWINLNVTLTNDAGFEWCTYPVPYDDLVPNISVWKTLFKYCKSDCPPSDCGQLRTQTPGGWGAPPRGHNPGAYLHANFDAAFPNGVTVGCTPGNFHASFSSAQVITDYLPAGATPSALTANYADPVTTDLPNTLVSHILALSLSVGFDQYDPNFGQAGTHLGDMVIGSGTFAGWTVSAFLDEANKVLGGCSINYTASQIVETADKINNNYTDGTINNGYLNCPR